MTDSPTVQQLPVPPSNLLSPAPCCQADLSPSDLQNKNQLPNLPARRADERSDAIDAKGHNWLSNTVRFVGMLYQVVDPLLSLAPSTSDRAHLSLGATLPRDCRIHKTLETDTIRRLPPTAHAPVGVSPRLLSSLCEPRPPARPLCSDQSRRTQTCQPTPTLVAFDVFLCPCSLSEWPCRRWL
jgi:hypothetical protein